MSLTKSRQEPARISVQIQKPIARCSNLKSAWETRKKFFAIMKAIVQKGAVFKWEDSPGLCTCLPLTPLSPLGELFDGVLGQVDADTQAFADHGCGVCGTCLNSAKAKRNCYGIHSEPCVRYHQTMFHLGKWTSFHSESQRVSIDPH